MRILSLDVGDKTIGVAVSDELGLTAQGVGVVKRTALSKDFNEIAAHVKIYGVSEIVVGLPKNMNGTIGPRGELVKEFAEKLSSFLPDVKIKFWDERLSTVAAEKSLISFDVNRKNRRKVIDKMAASFILQGYLDSLAKYSRIT
jgi:putative Holliday junction resolvase